MYIKRAMGAILQRLGSHRQSIPPERLARLLSARRLTSPIEERPLLGSSLDDLSEIRLEKYFRDRFSDWSEPDDWGSTLVAHKLAAVLDSGVTPTYLGVLLFAEQPERYIYGAYIDLAVYTHDTPDGNTVDSNRFVGPVPEQIAQGGVLFTGFSSGSDGFQEG